MNLHSTHGAAPITLVVVPRERFSRAELSLETLYATTDQPFDLIYLDGPSPPPIRRYLDQQAQKKRFRLLRLSEFVPGSRWRNLALGEVRSPYVVFIDNDVIVRPGWLEALRCCADETGAAVVGPLYLEHAGGREFIHMAGGQGHVTEIEGRRRCIEHHRFQGRKLSELDEGLTRERTELVEFHCTLIRTDVLQKMGGFDEGMKNTAEHVDFCLSIRGAGHEIYFEPAAVVVYVQPPPFARSDLPFFYTRWNDTWAQQTVAHFRRKWELDPEDPFLTSKQRWTTIRRRQIFTHFFRRVPMPDLGHRVADRVIAPMIDACAAKFIAPPTT